MSERHIDTKKFSIDNASLENFINFKLTFGIKEPIINYKAEIERIDDNNFLRKVETDMGFTGFLRYMVYNLVGTNSINAVENITYDLDKKEYKCVIGDPNEGKYKDLFSFREEYKVVERGNMLFGTLDVVIENNLPFPLNSYVEKSFFAQRHAKLRDELKGSVIDNGEIAEVIDDDLTSEKHKSLEQIAEEYSDQLSKEMANTQKYVDYYNDGYYPEEDEIPLC